MISQTPSAKWGLDALSMTSTKRQCIRPVSEVKRAIKDRNFNTKNLLVQRRKVSKNIAKRKALLNTDEALPDGIEQLIIAMKNCSLESRIPEWTLPTRPFCFL